MKNKPIGIKPKWIHDLERKEELADTIYRHLQYNYPINIEWVEEYNELVNNKRGLED